MTYEYEVRGYHPAVDGDVPVFTVADERMARAALAQAGRLTWRDTALEDFRLFRREVGPWEEVPDAP